MNYPRIPIAYNELKTATRMGLSAEARNYWWPLFPKLKKGEAVSQYPPDLEKSAQNRYDWATKKNPSNDPHSVDRSVLERTREILSTLGSQYDLQEPALIFHFISLLCVNLPSNAICLSIGCDLLERSDW